MKTRASLLSLLLILTSAMSHADTSGRRIDVVAVAEQTPQGQSQPQPSLEHPLAFIAIDGGYVEAGDSIAGERVPTPAAVAQALRDGLVGAGLQNATPATQPAEVLVYFWGLIRPMREPAPTSTLPPNFAARLALTAPSWLAHDIGDEIVTRRYIPGDNLIFHRPDWETALELSRGGHYFIAVTAYSFADLVQGKATRLWETRISTQETSGSMDEVIPSLAEAGANYFGRNSRNAIIERAPLVAPPANSDASALAVAPAFGQRIDRAVLRQILVNDYLACSGDHWNAEKRFSNLATLPSLPPPNSSPSNSGGPARVTDAGANRGLPAINPDNPILKAVGRTVTLTVRAERTVNTTAALLPNRVRPVFYFLENEGAMVAKSDESGAAAIANASAVDLALRAGLSRAGYEQAAAPDSSALVMVAHWGTIAPGQSAGQASDAGSRESILLSAYSADALRHERVTLLWRVRVEAVPAKDAEPREVLSTLAYAAGAMAADNIQPQEQITAALLAPREEALAAYAVKNSHPEMPLLEAPLFRGVLAGEKDRFLSERSPIPDQLARRIVIYGRDKAALESELAARTAGKSGVEQRNEIDRFNEENAGRIAALNRTREELRGEIARLAVEWAPAAVDRPLDALIAQFAAEMKTRDSEYASKP